MLGVVAVAVAVMALAPAIPASASAAAPVSPVTSVSLAGSSGSCTGGGFNPCGWDASKVMDLIAHPQSSTVVVASHRGVHALINGQYAGVPETSPEAIELAAKAGLAEIELDVKLDKDGTPVLSHDLTEGRQTNYSQDLGSLHECSSNDCFDPFGDPNDPTNAARNPLVSSLSDSDLANGNLYTRDSVSFKLSRGVIWHPITLQDALNRMTADGIQMVVALDIRTKEVGRAALPVVANTVDSMGRSYLSDTLFKVPFIAAPSADDVQQMFPERRSEVNYQPVFNTGDACALADGKCQGFGGAANEAEGETNLANALDDVETHSGVNVPAVELQIKKSGGNLQQLLETVNHYPGTDQRRSITIFSPFGDLDPSAHGLDPSLAPYTFLMDNGSCCGNRVGAYFKSAPGSESDFPPDTADQRQSLDFLRSEGVNGITTDNAVDIASQVDTTAADVLGRSPANSPVSDRSCDVYTFYGTPCTEAVSTTRALYATYDGPLYQVQRASDSAVKDIGLTGRGGYADAAAQDDFCTPGARCTITKIYDQSGLHNDLTVAGSGGQAGADHGADAEALPVTVNGHKVYGVSISAGVGYRDDLTQGIARNGSPEGMYMVASGTHVNDQCCFDFGNAERNNLDTGNGHMDAVNLSTRCIFAKPCNDPGPWVQADLENGLFQGGNGQNPDNAGNGSDFVTAMLKNDGTTKYALKGGDSQAGGLSTWWQGPLPDPASHPGYQPMQQEGGIVLGVGGDNSNSGVGSFFEGVMTQGYPADAADDAVQAGIVAAGYGGDSAGVSVPQNSNAAVVNGTLTNVFTVDAKQDHLWWSSLTAQGADWVPKDLWATAGTPPVLQGTTPVAVVHDGVTSVFTIAAADHHLWETHMRPGVTSFTADDLTVIAKTPPSKVTPSALFHNGYTTVYTVNASNGHLETTYLTALNGPWVSADLTAQTPDAPAVQPGTSPASILHDGVASVFTVGTGHDIWETYLPSINGKWSAHDITALSTGPQTTSTVTAVFHEGVLTVFAAGDPLRHLFKLSLPALGGGWSAQDLTAGLPHTPPVAPGTAPAALFHTGYTSVYTADEKTLDLQTTYLPSLAGDYATEDLSVDYPEIPPTTETPVPLLHPGDTGAMDRVSVFTVNHFDNDLQDSHLVKEGDPWVSQDLNYLYHVPPVRVNASPAANWTVASNGNSYAFTVCNGDLCVHTENSDGTWQSIDLTEAKVAPKVAFYSWPTAVAWDGHVSVFSVGTEGHLWQTDLPPGSNTWVGFDLTAAAGGGPTTGMTPTAVFHGGYISVYTVDDNGDRGKPGDLEEYYLVDGTHGWHTQDLSTHYPYTPQVAPYTAPVALYHDGYTSVFTADYNPVNGGTGGNDLQETYLSAIGNDWQTDDLTKLTSGSPMAPDAWPTAVYHSGYVGVYAPDVYFDRGGFSDLRATYLPAIGDKWQTQDLTQEYQVPKLLTTEYGPPGPGGFRKTDPVPTRMSALYHSGYTSVYYVTGFYNHLVVAFLPAIGDSWSYQDLTAETTGPSASQLNPPSALLHYDAHGGLTFTSVFTYNLSDLSLQDTFLPYMGGSWGTKTLP